MQKYVIFEIIEDFLGYIDSTFGLPVMAEASHRIKGIPLYLMSNYVLLEGEIAGRAVVWAKVVDEKSVTPDRLKEQKSQLQRLFGAPVVFVFKQLDSWQRKRLIERKIGFVQSNRQVYIPELLLQLNDTRPAHGPTSGRQGQLSFPAQVAILYHLQREPLSQQPARQIAVKLGYSAMTITRIIRELQKLDLVTVHPGKERIFFFKVEGQSLWELALPLLRNPIKEIWFADVAIGFSNLLSAGETALASYSDLAEGQMKYYAIGKDELKSPQNLERLPELTKHEAAVCLQVWQYDPGVIAMPGNGLVDKLSLYLTMNHEQDERVMAALEEMTKNIIW